MLEAINKITISAEELDGILAEAEKWEAEGRGGDGAGLFLVAQHYPGDHESAFAVHCRLLALIEMLQESESRGWVLPGFGEDTICTRFELVAAAASEPLIEVENRFTFDKKSFFSKALELAESEGQA